MSEFPEHMLAMFIFAGALIVLQIVQVSGLYLQLLFNSE